MLEKIRNKCLKLMEHDKSKYQLIYQILENDNCFFEMPIETAIQILLDLGYNIEQANKIYLNLIKKGD